MAGQEASKSRESVRACIKSVERNNSNTSKAPKQSFKTTSKQ